MGYTMIYINLFLLQGSIRAYGNMDRKDMFYLAREFKIPDSGPSSAFLSLQVTSIFTSLKHPSTSV